MKLAVSIKILRLLYFNESILKWYHVWLGNFNNNNNPIIYSRICIREEIEKELKDCIKEAKKTSPSFLQYWKVQFFEVSLKLEKYILFSQFPIVANGENGQFETQNLRQYYNVLFYPGLPKKITDLLLYQKNRIEAYMLKPI